MCAHADAKTHTNNNTKNSFTLFMWFLLFVLSKFFADQTWFIKMGHDNHLTCPIFLHQ